MTVRRSALFAVCALLLALAAGSASGASESELDDLTSQIEELSAQIESAEVARTDAGQEVLAARSRLDVLAGEVSQARSILASIQSSVAAGEEELASVEATLDHFEGALATTRLRSAEARDDLSHQVVELYMSASTSGARMLGFSGAAEASIGFAYVDGAFRDSNRLINQLTILEAEEERQQQILDEQRLAQQTLLAELAEQRQAQELELARVSALEAEAAEIAQAAESTVNGLTAQIARFEEHKDGLEADAAALEAELAAREQSAPQSSGPMIKPVPGGVSSPFGYRIHPIFGIKRLHTGWDLNAGSGEPIVAAADGVVVSASVRGGYGNAVVIDHGGGVATLYAHQSSMAVVAGQSVSQGQVIGYVGCTGYCTGAHLHWEVRLNGVPVDPRGYVG
ncbi:peptidoglycan DD-metalloendopeptidase family protein [soil metagenome]